MEIIVVLWLPFIHNTLVHYSSTECPLLSTTDLFLNGLPHSQYSKLNLVSPPKKYPTRQSTPPTPITSFLYFWLTSHFVRSNINLSKSCHFHTDERLLHFLITQLQKQPLPLLTPSFAESALLPACDTWTLHIKHCNGYGWVFRCFPVCKLMLYWPVLRERRHLAEHWYDCTNHLHMPASFCTLQGKCSDKWTVRPNPRRTANTAVKIVHYRWRTNQTMAALKVACHLRDGIIQD